MASFDNGQLFDLAGLGSLEPRGILICVLVLVLTTAAWRRFFSPLQSIPGPFWASVTRLWHFKIIIDGNQNEQVKWLHEKHGKFVRVAPKEVSVTHPDAVKKLLLQPLHKVYTLYRDFPDDDDDDDDELIVAPGHFLQHLRPSRLAFPDAHVVARSQGQG